jgi:pimeloyl-ACP methyl ester carboxylesterase
VLVDSLGLARFRPSPRFALGLIGFMVRPTTRSHQRFMGQCLADVDPVEQALGEKWGALRDYSIDRATDPGVKAAMKFFMNTVGVPAIPTADLAAISAPTSLVWGREDQANRLRVAQAASERFGWPLHVIDGSADDPPIEQPDAFVDAVLRVPPTG